MVQMHSGKDRKDFAPFVIDVDGDEFDLDDAEIEVAACKALSVHVEETAARVLKDHGIDLRNTTRSPSFGTRNRDAYDEGIREVKKIRREDEAT